MDAREVKEALLRVHECREDFTLVFSGKKNGRENGHYRPFRREITIHEANFTRDGVLNENLLLYTAVHELAHHILDTEMGRKGPRSHTKIFWAVFHDLLDKAGEEGVYRPETDAEVDALVEEARRISAEIAALQRSLGQVLKRLAETCERKGIRPEDVIERRAQISRRTMDECVKASDLALPEGTGMDAQKAAVRERDAYRRAVIIRAAMKGKTIAQIERPREERPAAGEEEDLFRKKARLEKTIAALSARLKDVLEKIGRLERETA
jgi:hypothetical protein